MTGPTTFTRRAVAGTLRLPGQPDLAVLALLDHTADAPDEVRIVPVLDDEALCTLVVDRGLMTAGLVDGAAGDGDVQVQVLADRVLLGIGELVVVVGTHDLTELLLATFAAAPTGSEQERVLRLDDSRTAAHR